MIQITLTPELARLLHQYGSFEQMPTAASRPFNKWGAFLKRTHSTLQPTFPNTSDEGLLPFFTLVATKPIPETALQQLRTLPGVEGAYGKPDDAPPGLP
jgi:hypothetical protein